MKNTLLLIITVATITFGGLHLSNRIKVSNLHEISTESQELCRRIKSSSSPSLICNYDEIIKKLVRLYANQFTDNRSLYISTTGMILDTKIGEFVELTCSELSKYDCDIFLSKNKFEDAKENINKDHNLKYAIYLLYALISYLIIFYLIPFSWYFFLRRVKEVADVIKK
jgi:hypothetical protein